LIHVEAWSKVSVVLLDRQIARLDRLVHDIHRATGAMLTRAAVIRALIDGVVGNGLNVAGISSESVLRDRIASRFKRRGPRAAVLGQLPRES
jgi:hypothetical protein